MPPELTPDEIARYSRHLLLPQVGADGQRRLKGASVAVVGAGGLGSPALLYLAAAGVGRIGLFDGDTVDVTNLQRQVAHDTAGVGSPKVASAAARIHAINPHVDVVMHPFALTASNALDALRPYDVILDGTDNFPTRYLLDDACSLLGKPYVYASIFQFEGQASVFNHRGGPRYRDLFPEPPPPGSVPSCGEAGVLGVLPGVMGVIQATEVLKLILGIGEPLSGRLLIYDALAMRFREFSFERDASVPEVIGLIDYQEFCGFGGAHALPAPTIAPADLVRRRAEGWDPYVLDVRTEGEAALARLAFTDRQHPHERVAEIAGALPKDRPIVVYCRSGARSARAAGALRDLGFRDVWSLDGGMQRWAAEIDPTLPQI